MEIYFNDKKYNLNNNILYESFKLNEDEQVADNIKQILSDNEKTNKLLAILDDNQQTVDSLSNDLSYNKQINNLNSLLTSIDNFKIN